MRRQGACTGQRICRARSLPTAATKMKKVLFGLVMATRAGSLKDEAYDGTGSSQSRPSRRKGRGGRYYCKATLSSGGAEWASKIVKGTDPPMASVWLHPMRPTTFHAHTVRRTKSVRLAHDRPTRRKSMMNTA